MIQYLFGVLLAAWFFAFWTYAQAATLAFPGAEGFGRLAEGGRGGKVIEVTNLNASGAGSLRACVEASGPRTCVFRVGGTIDLGGRNLHVLNPYLTIAGQTAPGDGIVIKGGGFPIQTHDIIIRYLRIRPGIWGSNLDARNNDAIQVIRKTGVSVYNVIIDHCSLSWAVDETASVYGGGDGVKDVTFQWNFITESLNCANHDEGCHGKGFLIGGGATNLSFHHNLLAHHPDRNPLLSSGNLDVVNNVIYNRASQGATVFPSEGVTKANIVKNYFKPGPSTSSLVPIRLMGNQTYHSGSMAYLAGNIDTVYRPNNSRPELDIVRFTDGPPNLPVAGSRFSYPSLESETDAIQAFEDVLVNAGATLPVRDTVDLRIVNEVKQGKGKIIDNPSQVGGYPTLASVSRSGSYDTDHDGMPDSWELAYGFNPNDASDGPQDADGDGYTNLEEFLNSTEPGGDVVALTPPKNLRVIPE
jgi:pectate lyase